MKSTFQKLNSRIPHIEDVKIEIKSCDLRRTEKQANLLMDNKLIFNRAWDMEPCHDEVDISDYEWNNIYTDDEEWTFMLNRLDYLKSLIVLSVAKNDKQYILKAKELMFDWIDYHPIIAPQDSTRTLDTGIRILNFIDLSSFLVQYDLLSEKELECVQESITKQANYLIDHYRAKDTLSNWGLVQVVALLFVYLNFNVQLKIPYEKILAEFNHQIEIQVLSDGIYWEQSTLYHGIVLEQTLKLIQELNTHEKQYDDIIIKKAKDLANALRMLTLPDGTIDPFGDSDRNDSVELLNKAAYVLKNEDYLFNPIADAETILLFFKPQSFSDSIEELFFDGYESGVFTHRTDKSKKANYTQFTNTSLGSAHGHGDHLNVSFSYKGNNILVDKGRFTYKESDFLRPYLKSSSAHNGIIINNSPMTLATGSWSYDRYAKPLANESIDGGSVHYYNGLVSSYHQGLELHQRQVITINEGIWLIIDRISHEGENTFKNFFHFDPSINLETQDTNILIQHPKDKLLYKNFSKDTLKICKTPLSYHYNSKQGTYSLKVEGLFTDEKINIHLFHHESIESVSIDIRDEKNNIVNQDEALGLRIKIGTDHHYDIALVHDERFVGNKNLYVDDYCFYGKIIVIENKNDKRIIYRFA